MGGAPNTQMLRTPRLGAQVAPASGVAQEACAYPRGAGLGKLWILVIVDSWRFFVEGRWVPTVGGVGRSGRRDESLGRPPIDFWEEEVRAQVVVGGTSRAKWLERFLEGAPGLDAGEILRLRWLLRRMAG
jgi:hypothetical protein